MSNFNRRSLIYPIVTLLFAGTIYLNEKFSSVVQTPQNAQPKYLNVLLPDNGIDMIVGIPEGWDVYAHDKLKEIGVIAHVSDGNLVFDLLVQDAQDWDVEKAVSVHKEELKANSCRIFDRSYSYQQDGNSFVGFAYVQSYMSDDGKQSDNLCFVATIVQNKLIISIQTTMVNVNSLSEDEKLRSIERLVRLSKILRMKVSEIPNASKIKDKADPATDNVI